MSKVKKAIVLTGGYGTRFLPLSKVIPKDFFPLVDQPMIYYILKEIKDSGIKEIIIVNQPHSNMLANYLTPHYGLENFLKERNKKKDIEILQQPQYLIDDIKITYVVEMETKPKGDGNAVLQVEKIIGEEPCAVLFSDDIVYCEENCYNQKFCLSQLIEIYNQYQVPIIGIHQLPKEKVSSYGVIDGQAQPDNKRVYKINKFVEKPKIEEAPSNLAVIGKNIITPEVFKELSKIKFDVNKDGIRLAYAFQNLIKQKKTILGYQFKGKWLECGSKLLWLQSHLYLLLKHPEYGEKMRQYLKDNQLI